MTPEGVKSWHNCVFPSTRFATAHDNARPDAAPQGLAQVEPGHRGGVVCAALHPQLPERRRRRGRPTTPSSPTSRDARSPPPSSAASTSSRWQAVPPVLRRQRRRQAAQAARDRPAHRPADDPGGGVAGRGAAPRASRPATPRCASASSSLPAFQENGQFIGDQRYRQLLRMQTPPMRPDEFEDQVRRSIVAEKLQAALTGWMTVADSDVVDRVQEAQREGQGRGRQLPRRQVPRGDRRDRRRGREALRGPQGAATASARSARSAT